MTTPTGLTSSRFGLVPVRSPLLGESRLLSFPSGTEMVHFPEFASPPYGFRRRCPEFARDGFPHSEISGSQAACASPKLIAACHVLHRLLAPRHPPYALSSLTIKFAESKVSWIAALRSSTQLCARYSVFKEPRQRRVQGRAVPAERPGFALAVGGEYRDRTGDLLRAKQALSQLS